jgi:hypothetical protein
LARRFAIKLVPGRIGGSSVGLAEAPAATAPVVVNPGGSIDVQADQLPLGELLRALAAQAGWDVALSAPQDRLAIPVTLHVKNRKPREVVKVLRAVSGLDIELDDGLLRVGVDGRFGDRDERWDRKKHRGKNHRVVMGHPLTIGPDDTVDDAIAIGGPLLVQGHVQGAAVSIGNQVTLAPTATVDGDVVAIGGQITIEPGATLRGSQVNLLSSAEGIGRWMIDRGQRTSGWNPASGWGLNWHIFSTLFRSIALLLFGLLLLTFAPDRIAVIAQSVGERPFLSLLVGVSLLMGLLPVCVLLGITLIGIPLIPIAIILFLAVLLVGATSTALRVGQGMAAPGGRRGVLTCFCFGVGLFTVVGLVPWFGTVLVLVVTLAGAAPRCCLAWAACRPSRRSRGRRRTTREPYPRWRYRRGLGPRRWRSMSVGCRHRRCSSSSRARRKCRTTRARVCGAPRALDERARPHCSQ